MFISVLICTKNRAESLSRTLDSFFCPSNLQNRHWETVVVDNDSDDHTAEVCRDFGERFPDQFRSLIEKKPGKSNALNTAIDAAGGDILAFTDDDVLCSPNYIQAIQDLFSGYLADAIQGRILLECEGGHPDWLDRYMGLTVGWRDCGDEVSDLDGTLCGTNMIVRAEVFQKIGGFSPQLGPGRIGLGEETELSLRILEAGYRVLYAPQVLIRHRLPRKRLNRAFFRKRFFQQGRAAAYYEPLPVSIFRFSLYLAKEFVSKELTAIWHFAQARPAAALRCQCEVYSQAGLLWQHWLFKHGTPRELSVQRVSPTAKSSSEENILAQSRLGRPEAP